MFVNASRLGKFTDTTKFDHLSTGNLILVSHLIHSRGFELVYIRLHSYNVPVFYHVLTQVDFVSLCRGFRGS